jgi:HK97 family phage portal protein
MGFIDRLLGVEESPKPFVPATENRAARIPSREEIIVNEETALSLVPVSRCISVLETAIEQIPVEVYRGQERIESPAWLVTPDLNKNVSQAELLGQTVVSMAVFGNAFWKITRGARGVVNIEILNPTKVSVTEDSFGIVTYSYFGRTMPSSELVHIKLWHKPGDVVGYGPIQRHRTVLRSALDLHNYSDNWFRTAAVPTGTLTTTEFLSADDAKANKDAFIESQRERSVAVLSSGLKYDSIQLNPEEAQFLENQKHVNRQIALMFGVPAIYLGMGIEGQGMTYVNGNEDKSKLYEDGLQQYIIRIQQAITDLLPRGQVAKFNLTEFLRPNQLVRYQSYQIALQNQFMTVNEVRSLEGMLEMEEQPAPSEPAPTVADEQAI